MGLRKSAGKGGTLRGSSCTTQLETGSLWGPPWGFLGPSWDPRGALWKVEGVPGTPLNPPMATRGTPGEALGGVKAPRGSSCTMQLETGPSRAPPASPPGSSAGSQALPKLAAPPFQAP